ncbi:ComEC family competence protein, partial [Haemophilus influenzae]
TSKQVSRRNYWVNFCFSRKLAHGFI